MSSTTMTVSDVADDLDVHPNTVYGWIRSGLLKAYAVGNRYKIKEWQYRDLLAQLEKRRATCGRKAVRRA